MFHVMMMKVCLYLLLCGVEGEVPDVQCVALLQQLLLFIAVTLETHWTSE